MAIQSARSATRTEVLENAVLNALVVLLVATLAAVVATYVSPPEVGVTPGTESQSLVDFRAGEKGFGSAEQQYLIDFRAGERPALRTELLAPDDR